MIFVVAVDRRTMEDLMAWEALARALSARPAGSGGLVLVYAPGEHAERMLEGEGHAIRGSGGLLRAVDRASAAALARAARSENRRITATLSDAGIPAVGFLGGDRGLLRAAAVPAWLAGAIRAGSVPVVASVDAGEEAARELPLSESVAWLSRLPGALAVFIADREPAETPARAATRWKMPRDSASVERLEARGISVRISTVSELSSLGLDP
jgi:hypothetical protein